MGVNLAHHILKLVLQFFENEMVVLLDKGRVFLSEKVGNTIKSSSESLVKQAINILIWQVLLRLLIEVDGLRHKSYATRILIYLSQQVLMDLSIVLIAYLAHNSHTTFSILLVIGTPTSHQIVIVLKIFIMYLHQGYDSLSLFIKWAHDSFAESTYLVLHQSF